MYKKAVACVLTGNKTLPISIVSEDTDKGICQK